MGRRLFVGNLSFQSTEDSIAEAFGENGRQVSSVSLMLDRETGRSRGFAFVEMATDEDARAAIESLNGKMLDGRAIRVDEAQERSGGGGGGGGGRGGGGGGGRGPRGDRGR